MNIDKIVARNDSKYDKDSKFYFRNVFIVILGELFWLRGRPIGLPLGQYISPSIIINKFIK